MNIYFIFASVPRVRVLIKSRILGLLDVELSVSKC